jgi:hypothetical protein
MSATLENPIDTCRFSPEEVEKKLYEMAKRDYQEFREFWWPMMQEQRRQEAEKEQEET